MQFRKAKLIAIIFLSIFFALPIFAQEFVYVSVEKTDLKSGTGLFAEKVAELKYGTKLLILENSIEDEWLKVAINEKQKVTGWILSANVTKRRVVKFMDRLSSKEKEHALAGKGSEMEKKENNTINFNSIKKKN